MTSTTTLRSRSPVRSTSRFLSRRSRTTARRRTAKIRFRSSRPTTRRPPSAAASPSLRSTASTRSRSRAWSPPSPLSARSRTSSARARARATRAAPSRATRVPRVSSTATSRSSRVARRSSMPSSSRTVTRSSSRSSARAARSTGSARRASHLLHTRLSARLPFAPARQSLTSLVRQVRSLQDHRGRRRFGSDLRAQGAPRHHGVQGGAARGLLVEERRRPRREPRERRVVALGQGLGRGRPHGLRQGFHRRLREAPPLAA